MITRRSFLANTSLAACSLSTRRLFAFTPVAPAIVRTPSGSLRGESSDGVRVFRGVPFAEPPVGPLRFLPTEKVAPWKSERDATKFSAAPMQHKQLDVPHSEDCLYLNIWAPEGSGPFPIFVWIHGGGFTDGHAFEPMYDGTDFAREGIISISVEYRLGIFGFLDYEPLLGQQYTGTANNALHDLMTGLAWIQENISAFGGDPARVTIGGESAGAKLIGTLMGIPSAQPLFHQMISESGGAERIWDRAASAEISKGFGDLWQKQSGETIANLKTAAGTALIQAQQQFIETWPQHFPLRAELDGPLIPRLPVETIASGSARGKRLLLGTNREESAIFIGPHPAKDATSIQLGNMSVAKFDAVYQHYKDIYPQLSVEERRIRAVTAEEYWIPSIRVAEAHLKGGGSAYVYELEFQETSGRLKGNAYHSLDVGMVWNHPHKQVADAASEACLGKQMHAAWSAFICGETPAAPGLPAWPLYDQQSRSTMVFGANANAESRVEQAPQAAELKLWNESL
ncbi:carboxylesterase/lipase family protein [Tunturiibacter gelidoferens]|uniref:Carboxylic ester hydrolase n=1 Tax=Tunturiibacter gelidiferens TaxID=3069689 RepID=A0AAU7Z1V9_9BACT